MTEPNALVAIFANEFVRGENSVLMASNPPDFVSFDLPPTQTPEVAASMFLADKFHLTCTLSRQVGSIDIYPRDEVMPSVLPTRVYVVGVDIVNPAVIYQSREHGLREALITEWMPLYAATRAAHPTSILSLILCLCRGRVTGWHLDAYRRPARYVLDFKMKIPEVEIPNEQSRDTDNPASPTVEGGDGVCGEAGGTGKGNSEHADDSGM